MRWLTGNPRVLLVGADRALLFLSEQACLQHAYEFTADEAGLAAFDAYLRQASGDPLSLLVDVVEEEYRLDTMPHVRGGDRRALLERRFTRLFRGTPYAQAIRQGREQGGRRDEKVLLSALTRPELVTPWVDRVVQRKVPLAGIYSLPLLSAALIPRLGASGSNVLVISVQRASGLRQTFFRDGEIRISRLAAMPRSGGLSSADFVLAELAKLRRYLNSLALASREAPLAVYLLGHGELLAELEQRCRNTETERYCLVDIALLAPQLGLGTQDLATCDSLFAQLLLQAPPRAQYARRSETRFHRLHRLANALLLVGFLTLSGAGCFSAWAFFEALGLRGEAHEAEQKIAFYTERTLVAHAALPRTPVDPPAIQRGVVAAHQLEQMKASPLPALRLLGQVLAAQPAVVLDRLAWERLLGSPADSGQAAAAPAFLTVLEVDAHLPGFRGDHRAALTVIDTLCAALRTAPAVRSVDVLRYPLDLRPDAQVQGSTGAATTAADGRFSLRVVTGVGHAAG